MKHCKLGDHYADESKFGPAAPGRLLGSCRKCIKKKIDRNRFQVRAFQAMFQAAKIGGQDNFYALASAIVGSCDDVFDKLPAGSVNKWLDSLKREITK